jgi:hypothetical protein
MIEAEIDITGPGQVGPVLKRRLKRRAGAAMIAHKVE